MKRTKKITADDGITKVTVSVVLETNSGGFGLSRQELARMNENVASGIMNVLANTRYLHTVISELKVR